MAAPDEFPPRENLLALLPRGTLWKVVSLLVLLAGVIFLRCRSDLLVGKIDPQQWLAAPPRKSDRVTGSLAHPDSGAPAPPVPHSPHKR